MDILENGQEQINMTSSFTQEPIQHPGGQISELRRFIKSSGVYALSSVATPLISLVLAPFLTHSLSTSDYGVLALLNTIIGLTAGITQLGMGSAFFRAYNYDYTEHNEKHSVVATATFLLFIVSMLMAIGAIMMAPFVAYHLLGHASFNRLIVIASGIVCLQNLAVPSFAWLRAENRALFYSLLSISNILTTLLANIVLVGILHRGIEGALIATGIGYIGVVFCTLSIITFRVGIKIRIDIARNLLGFGLPLIFSFVSYWVLQLSDRYLLSRLSSLEETAKYAIAYTLGTALSVVVIGPFTLAWPTTMFTIARSKDATRMFQMVFRWLSLFLLFTALFLSFCAVLVLNWFFPLAYHSVAFVIPIVSASMVFYGVYYIFMIGANIKRKTWTSGIFTTLAAVVNLLMNLALIPRYGAMGAALSTLVGYIVLALAAYIVNQKIYPVPFELGRFIIALLLGVALYAISGILAQSQGTYGMCAIYIGVLFLYGGCLTVLGKLPTRTYKPPMRLFLRRDIMEIPTYTDSLAISDQNVHPSSLKVYMHVLGPARPDVRVMREATALLQAGYAVSIVDVESEACRPIEEDFQGVSLQHIFVSKEFLATRFARWTSVRAALILYKGTFRLLRAPADIYHAHDVSGLLPCYIAARVRRKPLIFDAHELPLVDMSIRSRWLLALLSYVLSHIIPRCAGVITVSSPIAQEIYKHYHGPAVSLVRNIPAYKTPSKNNRLQQCLALSPTTRIALYQGYIMENRGLDLLVMAAKHLQPDIVIVIMGKDVNGLKSQLEALAIREGVTDRVKIIPPVPYIDLLNWTASADLGLTVFRPDYSLSIKMCLPNKLFEYLMAGLPILTSSLEAIVDMINKYDVGRVVHSLDPKDIGEAINAMFVDDSAYVRMRHNALDASRKDLHWEKEKQRLIQLYQRVVET